MNNTLDLQFTPVINPAPATLSNHQIEHYNRWGYISPLDVFDPPESAVNAAYLDRLLEQLLADVGAYSINCYQARCAGIWDLCTNDQILDIVQDLVGPNIICWASHFFCKLPGDPQKVPWHQDASYWQLSPARTVTVWLAIDDVDEDNAAMQFIPGTHNKGHLETRTDPNHKILAIETVGAEKMGQPFSNNLHAGQVSVHADMLVHGSPPNDSNRRRAGLTIRYCPPEVNVVDERWAQHVEPIICRRRDPYNRWRHHSRPQGDDVSLKNGPLNIGGN